MHSIASVCLSVCLSYSCCNFWKTWPGNFIFGMSVRLKNIWVKLVYQGHRVKVKVTWAINVTTYTHWRPRLVCLQLNGDLVCVETMRGLLSTRSRDALFVCLSVCLSVRLSVCLSHTCPQFEVNSLLLEAQNWRKRNTYDALLADQIWGH